jgi:hypothetical protein
MFCSSYKDVIVDVLKDAETLGILPLVELIQSKLSIWITADPIRICRHLYPSDTNELSNISVRDECSIVNSTHLASVTKYFYKWDNSFLPIPDFDKEVHQVPDAIIVCGPKKRKECEIVDDFMQLHQEVTDVNAAKMNIDHFNEEISGKRILTSGMVRCHIIAFVGTYQKRESYEIRCEVNTPTQTVCIGSKLCRVVAASELSQQIEANVKVDIRIFRSHVESGTCVFKLVTPRANEVLCQKVSQEFTATHFGFNSANVHSEDEIIFRPSQDQFEDIKPIRGLADVPEEWKKQIISGIIVDLSRCQPDVLEPIARVLFPRISRARLDATHIDSILPRLATPVLYLDASIATIRAHSHELSRLSDIRLTVKGETDHGLYGYLLDDDNLFDRIVLLNLNQCHPISQTTFLRLCEQLPNLTTLSFSSLTEEESEKIAKDRREQVPDGVQWADEGLNFTNHGELVDGQVPDNNNTTPFPAHLSSITITGSSMHLLPLLFRSNLPLTHLSVSEVKPQVLAEIQTSSIASTLTHLSLTLVKFSQNDYPLLLNTFEALERLQSLDITFEENSDFLSTYMKPKRCFHSLLVNGERLARSFCPQLYVKTDESDCSIVTSGSLVTKVEIDTLDILIFVEI